MAVKREIKTTLELDGERAFNTAIKEAGRNMRVMASELKAAAGDFALTGDGMAFVSKKSKILNDEIEQQEEIVRALEHQLGKYERAGKGAGATADGYRIKLNNAKATLSKLRKELEDNENEMAELGRGAERAGRQLESGLGEAAEDTARKFDAMVNKLDQDVGDIRGAVSFSAIADGVGLVSGAIQSAYDATVGLVENSADYNRQMAFLKINAEKASVSFEAVQQMAVNVSGLTGDMDATVEGLSNLLAAGLEGNELATAVQRLSGAIIQFPDTLKFESLADGLQESIATGNAVGQYAEYLERMGIDLETVNASLEEAKKQGQEAVETTALSWLSNLGAESAVDSFRENNAEMVAFFEAQATLTQAQADLAETLTPYVTGALSAVSEVVTGIAETIDWIEEKVQWLNENDPTNKKMNEIAEDMTGKTTAEQEAFYRERGKKPVDEWFTGADAAITENSPTIDANMETSAENATTSYTNAVYAAIPSVATAYGAMHQAAQAALSKPLIAPPIGIGATNYGGQAFIGNRGSAYGGDYGKATIKLDGKAVGEGMVKYNSGAMGKAVQRASTYLTGGQ